VNEILKGIGMAILLVFASIGAIVVFLFVTCMTIALTANR
jgi:hypothetical protein